MNNMVHENENDAMTHNESTVRKSSTSGSVSMSGSFPMIEKLAKEQAYKAPRTLGNVPSGMDMK